MEILRASSYAWLELVNPLMGLSVRRAQAVFDFARAYGSPQLQYIYNEIEATDPVLLTCVERRAAAIAAMGWKFTARSEEDPGLAAEQRDALKSFAANIENLTEALEHLDLAFFRGFSHVQPIWENGTVRRISLLKSWNFLHDRLKTVWYWNPETHATPAGLEVITPDARLVTVARRRTIDYPALTIYIRHALGERDWGRFVEHYGIPPADITMPPNATEKDKPKFEAAADAAQNAQNIVLPSGSTVSRAAETRGQNPFLDFCNYQAKQILILATGGTLATLAEGNTGTLAGNAQENVWKQIVARDGTVISDALNRALFRPYLREAFPGRPIAVDFELGDEKTLTAAEVFDLAAKAKSAGWRIAQDELEEASGFTLEREETAPQGGIFGLARAAGLKTPFKTRGELFKNARGVLDGQGEGERRPPAQIAKNRASGEATPVELLKALAKDTQPAAEAIARFLELIEAGATDDQAKEQAAAIIREMPGMLPEEPAGAAVIAEAMAEAYGEAVEAGRAERAEVAAASGTSEGAKKGWETRRRNGWTPEQLAENKAKVDGLIADLSRTGPDGKGKAWKNNPQDLGEISESLAADISAANPAMKATAGTMQTIDHKQLNHALIEHGVKEKLPSHIPITTEDLKKIPDVLSDYDEIRPGKGIADGKGQEAVVFRKKYDDGTVCCVEIDWFSRGPNRHELKFQTMWKEKLEEKK